MELRCKNCEARISVPSIGPLKEVQCPKCGVMIMLPTRKRRTRPEPDDAEIERKHDHALRRVFDPIPRPLMYLAGVVFALALLAPFWTSLLPGGNRNQIFLADDAESLPVPTNSAVPTTPLLTTNRTMTADLTHFAGVHLESRREEYDHRFNLILQNTRGMQPEIYFAQPGDEIQQFTGQFYDGILKEFLLLMREQALAPAAVQQQLAEQFGDPAEETEVANATTGLTGLGLGADPVTKRLAAYAHRRNLVWADANHRVEVAIYYSNGDAPQPVSVLQIRILAVAWLKASRPMMGSGAPLPAPVTNTSQSILNPIVPLERRISP